MISCLRRAGVEVTEHNIGVWAGRVQKWRPGPVAAARLAVSELRLLRRPHAAFDALIVGYPGHADLPAARRAAGGRPLLILGVLLVVVGIQLLSLGLITELITSHNEERAPASERARPSPPTRWSGRWR